MPLTYPMTIIYHWPTLPNSCLLPTESIISNYTTFWYLSFLGTSYSLCLKCLSIFSPWKIITSVQFSSVTQSCLTLCDPIDCSTPGFPVHHQLLELAHTQVHWVCDAVQPSHSLSSLLLLHSVFPSSRVFSYGSVLQVNWSKYWNFSFSISPSNEYSRLIINIQVCLPLETKKL